MLSTPSTSARSRRRRQGISLECRQASTSSRSADRLTVPWSRQSSANHRPTARSATRTYGERTKLERLRGYRRSVDHEARRNHHRRAARDRPGRERRRASAPVGAAQERPAGIPPPARSYQTIVRSNTGSWRDARASEGRRCRRPRTTSAPPPASGFDEHLAHVERASGSTWSKRRWRARGPPARRCHRSERSCGDLVRCAPAYRSAISGCRRRRQAVEHAVGADQHDVAEDVVDAVDVDHTRGRHRRQRREADVAGLNGPGSTSGSPARAISQSGTGPGRRRPGGRLQRDHRRPR